MVLTQLVQAVAMAVLIGSVVLHIGTSQALIVRRQPVLFFCIINAGVFAALVSFTQDVACQAPFQLTVSALAEQVINGVKTDQGLGFSPANL